MKKKTMITALLLICFLGGFASILNLNGRWTGQLKTDQGDEYPLLYNFKIDGEKLTGTAKTPKGNMPINNGIIKNGEFTFYVLVAGMQIDHHGQFYGDSVGVDIKMGDQGHMLHLPGQGISISA